MPESSCVGILGATSLVGRLLMTRLVRDGFHIKAYSRHPDEKELDGVEWRLLESPAGNKVSSSMPSMVDKVVDLWISAAPIWTLPGHFSLLDAQGARRIVALSSTSRFTKTESPDVGEQDVAHLLVKAEAELQSWAEERGVEWVILRPTLIYGLGRDKNITEIARFIRRFYFFPVIGKARGLRQPIHVADVVEACTAALMAASVSDRDYNISGGEVLSYCEMVTRVFSAMGRTPRLVPVPLWAFRFALAILRLAPRYRNWSVSMAERMNHDLVFDHNDAAHDFDFKPRPFILLNEDLAK